MVEGCAPSWLGITGVYLFEMTQLLATLTARGVKIGITTSLRKADVEPMRKVGRGLRAASSLEHRAVG